MEETTETNSASGSWRTDTDTRLEALEKGHGPKGDDTGDGDSLAGLVRTQADRIKQLETIQAENTSAILRLADQVAALVKSQPAPVNQ
jgi:CBS domain containing-hemolysin-like protein